MFDRLDQLTTELEACFASMEVDCFDAARAARLVSSGERVRRLGDAIRTIGVGQVERTNGWKGQGAKSISEWLSIETGLCPL